MMTSLVVVQGQDCQRTVHRLSNGMQCCGIDQLYNTDTQFCCANRVSKRAGSSCYNNKLYNLRSQQCCNGVVNSKISSRVCCGTTTCNPFTQLCCNKQVFEKGVDSVCCTYVYYMVCAFKQQLVLVCLGTSVVP